MRAEFVNALDGIMSKESAEGSVRTCLITGDLGFSIFEAMREHHPAQFINAGLSEQSMIGMAAGMAFMGKNVYVYSMIPFILYRAFEQVRDDICVHNLPVRLIATGASFWYANSGATHQPLEDLQVADALPNLTILNPSDPYEVAQFMPKLDSIKGPVLMRLAKSDELLHKNEPELEIGKALQLVPGTEILLVSSGLLTKTALEVASMLNKDKDGTAEVLEIHTFKPFDFEAVVTSAAGKKLVVTIEDTTGALAAKVLSAIAGKERQGVMSFKLPDEFTQVSGTREFLFDSYGLSAPKIYEKIKGVMK